MRVLIVIPARGGSTRVPRKNMQVVGGMTLVARAYMHALMIKELLARPRSIDSQIIVSTDDIEIADHVMGFSGVARIRPAAHHGDIPIVDVLKGMRADEIVGPDGYILLLQATTPQRDPRTVDAAVRWAVQHGYDSMATVGQNGKREGSAYLVRVSKLYRDSCVFDGTTFTSHADNTIDINTPADLEEARRILGP